MAKVLVRQQALLSMTQEKHKWITRYRMILFIHVMLALHFISIAALSSLMNQIASQFFLINVYWFFVLIPCHPCYHLELVLSSLWIHFSLSRTRPLKSNVNFCQKCSLGPWCISRRQSMWHSSSMSANSDCNALELPPAMEFLDTIWSSNISQSWTASPRPTLIETGHWLLRAQPWFCNVSQGLLDEL